LVENAEKATEALKTREAAFEEERASSSAELEALRAKQHQMTRLLEQEHAAAEEVRDAMGALREQLLKEEATNQGTATRLETLQSERSFKEAELEKKELELRALRAEYEELESDMFTPTLVQLNRLQAEHTGTQQALQEMETAHFSGDKGIGKGLGAAVCFKGIGELDIPRMVEEWGMKDESNEEIDDNISPFKLQADLLETRLGFKVDSAADPPQYVVDDQNEQVTEIRERYPEHSEEILEHLRQVHSEYVGVSSAGTIVRIPWHEAGDRAMTTCEVIRAFSGHLDKVNKRMEVLLAND